MTDASSRDTALGVLLARLAIDLGEAAQQAEEARQLLAAGNRNGAIGTLLAIEKKIERANALKTALLELHRE